MATLPELPRRVLRRGAYALGGVLLAACSGGRVAGDGAEGPGSGSESGSVNALDAGNDAPDWSALCTGSLDDAGFSSLGDLPVARLCAEGFDHEVFESELTCQGYRLVSIPDGVDCGGWWLFEAATGALVAMGGGCNTSMACIGAVAGFRFPYQCFVNGGWPLEVNLCAEGGIVDAGPETSE